MWPTTPEGVVVRLAPDREGFIAAGDLPAKREHWPVPGMSLEAEILAARGKPVRLAPLDARFRRELDFCSRFLALQQSGRPAEIDFNGQQVRPALELADVPARRIIRVVRETSSATRAQALCLSTSKGRLRLNNGAARAIVLWSDTAPVQVEIALTNRVPTTLRIWNGWRLGSSFVHSEGYAGVIADETGDSSWTLRCSDGEKPPLFEDLVVRLEIVEKK
jgi:hypothetical protein